MSVKNVLTIFPLRRSDHYMQVLNCKQHCAVELASHTSRDKPFEDFLPSHFNYLQFSYYNSESLITNHKVPF